MSEQPEIYNTELDSETVPSPEDLEAERAEATRIADAAIAGDEEGTATTRPTPWIAQQLGSLSEVLSQDGQHDAAARVAYAAIDVALATGDLERMQANINTLGNALGRAGDWETATVAYRKVLDVPQLGSRRQRALAHLALAQLYARAEEPKKSIYHFERGVSMVDKFDRTGHEGIIATMKDQYAATRDIVGVAWCSRQLGIDPLPPLRRLFEQPRNTDFILRYVTRAQRLGDMELAGLMKEMWLSSRTRGGS